MNFFEKVEARVKDASSLLCVGLDPRTANAAEAREQCFRIIEATHEFAAVFKANSAFYEVFGAEGMSVLRDVIQCVPPEIPVILDAKRGDIADTNTAYAKAAFETFGAAAVTASPYLGGDALEPFLGYAERGVFVLCRTSNASADELQALQMGDDALFEIVAQHAQRWNTRNNIGLVVGATDPAHLQRVRELAPTMWILVPGIGAQGGDLEATLRAGLRDDGMGLVINASRTIASTPDPRTAAQNLRDEINIIRSSSAPRRADYARPRLHASRPHSDLAQDLLTSECVRFGEFTLKSGKISPIYLDLRRLVSHPAILKRVAHAYAELLHELKYDRIAGIPYAALPIATAVSLELNQPLIYPRREAKEYGTRATIEGDYNSGETAVVLDDLVTTGDTKIEAIEKLTGAGLRVRDIVVLIDREQGGGAFLAQAGYHLHAVTTLPKLLEEWRTSNAITAEQYAAVKNFLESA